MNPEKQPSAPERGTTDIESAATERQEQLKSRLEKGAEQSPERQAEHTEQARKSVEQVFSKEAGKEQARGGEPTARAVRRVTSKEKQATYKHTMKQIRSEMSPGARAFSKVIHAPAVERASDTVGGSIARPNALLAGSMSAFLLVTAVYLLARHYGYALSGFETIAAFVFGWLLGLIYDYVRIMVTGRRP